MSALLQHGSETLGGEGFVIMQDGVATPIDQLMAPAMPGLVHFVAPSDPSAQLDVPVYTPDMITAFPLTGDHSLAGIDIYVRDQVMCSIRRSRSRRAACR